MGKSESVREHASSDGVHLPAWVEPVLDDAREWCRGRWWIPRAVLLLYLVYAGWRMATDPDSSTLFGGITFAIHEMGHLIFSFAGHFIGSLMGSGTQVLVPLIVMIIFFRQPDYFGVAVGGFWLSYSMFDWARYVADARLRELPLIGFTDDPEHDWHYLLKTTGLLNFDTTIAFLIRVAASAVGIASLAFGVWLLVTMARTKKLPQTP